MSKLGFTMRPSSSVMILTLQAGPVVSIRYPQLKRGWPHSSTPPASPAVRYLNRTLIAGGHPVADGPGLRLARRRRPGGRARCGHRGAPRDPRPGVPAMAVWWHRRLDPRPRRDPHRAGRVPDLRARGAPGHGAPVAGGRRGRGRGTVRAAALHRRWLRRGQRAGVRLRRRRGGVDDQAGLPGPAHVGRDLELPPSEPLDAHRHCRSPSPATTATTCCELRVLLRPGRGRGGGWCGGRDRCRTGG